GRERREQQQLRIAGALDRRQLRRHADRFEVQPLPADDAEQRGPLRRRRTPGHPLLRLARELRPERQPGRPPRHGLQHADLLDDRIARKRRDDVRRLEDDPDPDPPAKQHGGGHGVPAELRDLRAAHRPRAEQQLDLLRGSRRKDASPRPERRPADSGRPGPGGPAADRTALHQPVVHRVQRDGAGRRPDRRVLSAMARRPTKAGSALRDESGYSLVELLVASVMALMLIAVGSTVMIAVNRVQPGQNARDTSIQNARNTMERLTRELRQGSTIYTATPTQLSYLTYVHSATCGG